MTPFYRGFGGNYRVYETRGFEAWREEWEAAIQHDATWVEIVTWNDWGEASYICPFGEPRGHGAVGRALGADASHTAYLDASRYYIDWYKSGTPPAIGARTRCTTPTACIRRRPRWTASARAERTSWPTNSS